MDNRVAPFKKKRIRKRRPNPKKKVSLPAIAEKTLSEDNKFVSHEKKTTGDSYRFTTKFVHDHTTIPDSAPSILPPEFMAKRVSAKNIIHLNKTLVSQLAVLLPLIWVGVTVKDCSRVILMEKLFLFISC
jgi:hypothetical protein